MTTDYKSNVHFQHKHMGTVIRLLKINAHHMVDFRLAGKAEDTKQATDMVIHMEHGLTIGVRIRRHMTGKRYRDFTIRSKSFGGGKTELDKLREGWGDWYFYAWEDHTGRLNEWVLVSLKALRDGKAFDKQRREIPNTDGTKFVALSLAELRQYKALVAGEVSENGYCFNMYRAEEMRVYQLPAHLLESA